LSSKGLHFLNSYSIDFISERSTALDEVQKVLLEGGCVALPSDTVYGLVTLLKFSPKLFFAKKRPPTKPVALFIHSPEVIKRYAEQTVDDQLLRKLLPGKVTLLFRRIPGITDSFNFNTNLVGKHLL
jgi:tRNA A37 threonylcarbamoyladenosine synthetase subunit TsaC/SUA5/YrdC